MDLQKLAKATIINVDTGSQIPVMYNPETYSLEQGNSFAEVDIPGLPAPPLQYVRGKSRVLTMELFFDSYEAHQDVRLAVGPVLALLDQRVETKAPPVLLFNMGPFSFRCVLVDAPQKYTMFDRDGTPVRCTVSARFQEFVDVSVRIEQGVFFGPPTLANIGQAQTLDQIASKNLGDPLRWKEIAAANNIDDPLNLPTGAQITIPGTGGR
jgi:hypothetical protein